MARYPLWRSTPDGEKVLVVPLYILMYVRLPKASSRRPAGGMGICRRRHPAICMARCHSRPRGARQTLAVIYNQVRNINCCHRRTRAPAATEKSLEHCAGTPAVNLHLPEDAVICQAMVVTVGTEDVNCWSHCDRLESPMGHMCLNIQLDMCIDMCIDMCVDM